MYSGLDPVESWHHWVTVCCRSDLLLILDSFKRSLAEMEKDYTQPQLPACFLRAYSDRTIVTNTFTVQDLGTAVCGRYAILVARLFIKKRVL